MPHLCWGYILRKVFLGSFVIVKISESILHKPRRYNFGVLHKPRSYTQTFQFNLLFH